jgi:hypothetical protein
VGWRIGARFPETPLRPDQVWVPPTHQPIPQVAGMKRPELKDDSSSAGAEVKNTWGYASDPPYVFLKCRLIMYKNNFTLHFRLPERKVRPKKLCETYLKLLI